MTVPVDQEWSTAALVGMNTGLLAVLTAAGSAGCTIKIYDALERLLSTVPLTDPPGTVDGGTGKLTLTPSGPDPDPVLTEKAAYVEIHDAAGAFVTRMPAILGNEPVAKRAVFNTLAIVEGTEVVAVSLEIGFS